MIEGLGKRLVKFRRRFDYSQDDVANILMVSRQSVIKWEADEASPSIEFIVKLAELYKCSVDDLLNLEKSLDDIYKEEEKKKSSEPGIHISDGGILINDHFGKSLNIGKDGVHIKDKDDDEDTEIIDVDGENIRDRAFKTSQKRAKKLLIISSITLSLGYFLAIVAYVLLGCFVEKAWAIYWTLLFVPPVLTSIVDCFAYKDAGRFNIVFAVLFVYLFLGMFGIYHNVNYWHPTWIVFFAIPVYYMTVAFVRKLIRDFKDLSKV